MLLVLTGLALAQLPSVGTGEGRKGRAACTQAETAALPACIALRFSSNRIYSPSTFSSVSAKILETSPPRGCRLASARLEAYCIRRSPHAPVAAYQIASLIR